MNFNFPLLSKKVFNSGRNNSGKIVIRHRGGGHKRFVRVVNFFRNMRKYNNFSRIISILYDPNRNNKIVLRSYIEKIEDSKLFYRFFYTPYVTSSNVKGRVSSTFSYYEYYPGSTFCLYYFPIGLKFHGIEFYPFNGVKIARSTGSVVQLLRRRGSYVIIRMPSGEIRKISGLCFGTLGSLPESSIKNSLLKAGRSRWLGIRPHVRGVAINPVDHPHGGNTSGGRCSVTPWAKITKGLRTRLNTRFNKYIIKPRFIVKRRRKKK
jgi:large subunit ribosomal protein L2